MRDILRTLHVQVRDVFGGHKCFSETCKKIFTLGCLRSIAGHNKKHSSSVANPTLS